MAKLNCSFINGLNKKLIINNKLSLGNALSLPARTRSSECQYLDGLERAESPRDNSPCPQLIVTSPTSDGAHMFNSSEQVKMHLSQIISLISCKNAS